MLDESAISEIERRVAAFHEAGHVVVLGALGGCGIARIWPNTPRPPEDKAWLGQTAVYGYPGQVSIPDNLPIIRPLPPRWRIYFGLAGMVAEQLARGQKDPGFIAGEIEGALILCDVSATDLEYMTEGWQDEDVEAVVQILLERWDQVMREAESLMARDS